MRLLYTILIFITFSCSFLQVRATPKYITFEKRTYGVDSIIDNVLKNAPSYAKFIQEYHAEYYIKERMNIEKKNILFRYLPFMFKIKNGERQYIRELCTSVHYTIPDIYDQKKIASVGTIPRSSSLLDAINEYFQVNIYSNSIFYQKIISPLSKEGKKYYTFELDSIGKDEGDLQYKVKFTPRYRSDQLIEGWMIISDGNWSIRNFFFKGYIQFVHFESNIDFGALGSAAELLPIHYDMNVRMNFFGNKVKASYMAAIKYQGITLEGLERPLKRKSKYDLSDSFLLSNDTTTYSSDRYKFNGERQIPLDSLDHSIYNRHDSLVLKKKYTPIKESKAKVLWGQVGDIIIDQYNINFNNAGSIKCSPLFNPFLMGYSDGSGFSYKMSFKYNCLFPHDKLLRILPYFGYNFKEKRFYWRINTEFDYYPSKRGAIHIDAGNGNLIYGAEVFKNIPNIDTSKMMTSYQFKDYYLSIYHSIELINGLMVNVGITGHKRSANIPQMGYSDIRLNDIRLKYNSWAPRVKLEWTPAQYYYMSGRRKINFKSAYPTFSVDWERGIQGFLQSDCGYERWEFDMQQTLKFGVLRKLYYRVGTGLYTNNHSLYFIDFLNFTRNALPEQWNDENNSSFQLLKADCYNSSRNYFQIHLTYESPFLIIPRIMKIMRNVVVERLYFNYLQTPKLKPYYELGYGISTHYFSFRAYTSFEKGKYVGAGTKFTFELFD